MTRETFPRERLCVGVSTGLGFDRLSPHPDRLSRHPDRLSRHQVICRDVHHNQAAVFAGAILRCSVEEAAGHIQQRISLAIHPHLLCRVGLRLRAGLGCGWRRPKLIPRSLDGGQQDSRLLFGQPDPEVDHAVLAFLPRHDTVVLLRNPAALGAPETGDHLRQLRSRRRHRQLGQPLLIDHINDPGHLPHLRIRQPALLKQARAMVGMRRKAVATRTCSRATCGVIEHAHDNQSATDLKPVQCFNPPIASNSPINSNKMYCDLAVSAAAAQIRPANPSAATLCSRKATCSGVGPSEIGIASPAYRPGSTPGPSYLFLHHARPLPQETTPDKEERTDHHRQFRGSTHAAMHVPAGTFLLQPTNPLTP